MDMNFEQVKQYWEERASTDSSAQSTTQDFYLREIEFRVLKGLVERYRPAEVMDVGCGDARTTARLAAEFPGLCFLGGDYSEAMVKNARSNIERAGIGNLRVGMCDVSRPLPDQGLSMVYTTRCLINLPSWQLQQQALGHLYDALAPGGVYAMIENFMEGHDNFNQVRRSFGLPPIPVREHNLFFERSRLLEFISERFEILEEINISSSYYLVSRVVYSMICQEASSSPDYFDDHHRHAAQLPFTGEYGPVRLLCMRRR